MLRRRAQRFCSQCGRRMGRLYGFVGGNRTYDAHTGQQRSQWAWACRGAVNWWNDGGPVEFYQRTWHDARGISTSGARRRLEPS